MEKFDINSQNEFQKKSSWDMIIDGKFSDAEKREITEVLEWEKSDILDTTNGKLATFLHSDIIPHLESSGLSQDVKNDLIKLAEKYPPNTPDLWVNIPKQLQATLSQWELDLSVERAVWDIEKYVSENLQLPQDSNISSAEYQSIILSTGKVLQDNLGDIEDIIKEMRDGNPQLSDRELTWMINSEISAHFDALRVHTIVPLQIYIKYSSENKKKDLDMRMREKAEKAFTSQRHPNPDAPVNSRVDAMVESKYRSLKKQNKYFQRVMKDAFIDGNIENVHELSSVDTLMGVLGTEYHNSQQEIKENLDISLLNEKDKQIESEAMLYFLCAVWVQCLPYVWAVPWLAADATDIFSSQDATLTGLKEAWLVPKEYHMEKTAIDHVLPILGIALTPIGLQWLAKGRKLAKAVKGIKHLSAEVISRSLEKFGNAIGIDSDTIQSLKELMGVKSRVETPTIDLWKYSDLIEIKNGKRVSRWVAPEEIRKIHANLSDPERIQVASEILGITLSEKQQQALLKAHYTETWKNIIKGRVLMKEWDFSRQEAQILMDVQLAGMSERWWNKVFFKDVRDRTIPIRYWRKWKDPEIEYESLKGMSEISEKVAKPLWAKFDEQWNMIWYNLEEITNRYIWDIRDIPNNIKQEILSEFEKLHVNGFTHGDINSENILIYYPDFPNTSTIDFKIIDPVWFPKNFEFFDAAKSDDIASLKRILGTIEEQIQLRYLSSTDELRVWQNVYAKWNDGKSYSVEIVWWNQTHYQIKLQDGRILDVPPDSIQLPETPNIENIENPWDISNINIVNEKDIMKLFEGNSDLYRQISDVVPVRGIHNPEEKAQIQSQIKDILGGRYREIENRITENTKKIDQLEAIVWSHRSNIEAKNVELQTLWEENLQIQQDISNLEQQLIELEKKGLGDFSDSDELVQLSELWNNWIHQNTHVIDAMKAYSGNGNYSDELIQAQQKLKDAQITIAKSYIDAPKQWALKSYELALDGKRIAAIKSIEGDIVHYRPLIQSIFWENKEPRNLSISELKTLASRNTHIENQSHTFTQWDWEGNKEALGAAIQKRKEFIKRVWDIEKFESQKDQFIVARQTELSNSYDGNLNRVLENGYIQSNETRQLEEQIQTLTIINNADESIQDFITQFLELWWQENLENLQSLAKQNRSEVLENITQKIESQQQALNQNNQTIQNLHTEIEEVNTSIKKSNTEIRTLREANDNGNGWMQYLRDTMNQVNQLLSS